MQTIPGTMWVPSKAILGHHLENHLVAFGRDGLGSNRCGKGAEHLPLEPIGAELEV